MEQVKVTVKDLLASLSSDKPGSLKVSQADGTRALRAAFSTIVEHLSADGDRRVDIPGFGKFRVRMVELEKDGEKISRKKIMFKPEPSKDVRLARRSEKAKAKK